jgi:hypothetical protein
MLGLRGRQGGSVFGANAGHVVLVPPPLWYKNDDPIHGLAGDPISRSKLISDTPIPCISALQDVRLLFV